MFEPRVQIAGHVPFEDGSFALTSILPYLKSNFEFNIIENGKIVEKTVDISETPNGYNKLDAILSFQLSKNDKKLSQLRFIIQNITNTNYRDYLNRMRFYASEIGRNFQVQLNFRY